MSISFVDFIKHDPILGEAIGRGPAYFVAYFQFLLNNKNLGVKKDSRRWVYNSLETIAQQTKYSIRQIKRITSKLKDLGILSIEKLNPYKTNRTNYYSIDEQKLAEFMSSNNQAKCPNAFGHNVPILTKNSNKELNTKSNKSDKIDQFEKLTQEENTKLRPVAEHKPSNTTCKDHGGEV